MKRGAGSAVRRFNLDLRTYNGLFGKVGDWVDVWKGLAESDMIESKRTNSPLLSLLL